MAHPQSLVSDQPIQESKNHMAPVTVKLGNFSNWNFSRDFGRVVKQPVDRGWGDEVFLGYALSTLVVPPKNVVLIY